MDFPPVPYSIVLPTAYGQMIVDRHDINQTAALVKTGKAFDSAEIELLTNIVRLYGERQTVLDVGSNFGMHALAFARSVSPQGKVHAFEPQRIIFNMLAGSVALNALSNVYCYNMAVGNREGQIEIPQFDYAKPLNFGSVEFGPEQRESLAQQRGRNPDRVETVPLTTLDRMNFTDVGMIKIDVEGMEIEVLEGAQSTISKWRPVLYVEYFKVDREALRDHIAAWDYDVRVNAVNYLCIPSELKYRIPIAKI